MSKHFSSAHFVLAPLYHQLNETSHVFVFLREVLLLLLVLLLHVLILLFLGNMGLSFKSWLGFKSSLGYLSQHTSADIETTLPDTLMFLELTHDISLWFIFILVYTADGELTEARASVFSVLSPIICTVEGYIVYTQYILSKRMDQLA